MQHPELVRSLVLAEPPLLRWLPELQDGRRLYADFMDNMWEPTGRQFRAGNTEEAMRVTIDWFGQNGYLIEGRPARFDTLPPEALGFIMQNVLEWQALTTSSDAFPLLDRAAVRAVKVPILLMSGQNTMDMNKRIDAELERVLPKPKRWSFPARATRCGPSSPTPAAREPLPSSRGIERRVTTHRAQEPGQATPGRGRRPGRTSGIIGVLPTCRERRPMFDHVKFGVSDYQASKTFFLKALEPLGIAVVGEGRRPTASSSSRRRCVAVPVPDGREAGAPAPGVRRRESTAGRRLPSRGPGGGRQGQRRAWPASRTTTPTTTRRSSSGRTGTTSKWCAQARPPKPDASRSPMTDRTASCSCGQLQAHVTSGPDSRFGLPLPRLPASHR